MAGDFSNFADFLKVGMDQCGNNAHSHFVSTGILPGRILTS